MLDKAARQARSAGHYVVQDSQSTSLQTTLTIATRALNYPIGMILVLDRDSHRTVSAVGVDVDVDATISATRQAALCDAVVQSGRPVIVENAATDGRYTTLETAASSDSGAFVGVPLIGRESLVIGTLCVIDPRSRPVGADQVARLVEFAKVVEDQLDLIRRLGEQLRQGRVATAELEHAISSGKIVPWYQPVADLSTGRVVAFEALARWEQDVAGPRPPNSFVPLAEDSDLVVDLDHAIMRQALRDLSRWRRIEPDLRLNVNLSSRHFERPDWIGTITAAAADSGVPPESIDLELTETAQLVIGHYDGSFVRVLQDKGFRVWLDDFGTGWSSLEYLLRLPVNGIKIDRVMSVALGSHIGNALTRSVTSLAQDLGLSVTIEGIETPEQAELARRLGCGFGQGYLWSRAVPAPTIDNDWLPLRLHIPYQPPTFAVGEELVVPPQDGNVNHVAVPELPTAPGHIGDGLAAAVLRSLPDATAVLDGRGMITAVNHAWRMFALDNGGDPTSTGVGVNYLDVCERAASHGSDDARQVGEYIRGVLAGTYVEAELEYPCPSPAVGRWYMVRITRLDGIAPGVVVSHVNITRRKRAEDELSHAASYDSLSGLANRTLLETRLAAALAPAGKRRHSTGVGVIYLDLDGFKAINDTYGHGAGDEVLQLVARKLQALVRPTDTVARLGGDEFVIVVPQIQPANLTALNRRIRASLALPMRIHGQSVSVGGSVGVHLAHPGETPKDALALADRAMYITKAEQRAMANGIGQRV